MNFRYSSGVKRTDTFSVRFFGIDDVRLGATSGSVRQKTARVKMFLSGVLPLMSSSKTGTVIAIIAYVLSAAILVSIGLTYYHNVPWGDSTLVNYAMRPESQGTSALLVSSSEDDFNPETAEIFDPYSLSRNPYEWKGHIGSGSV